MAGRHALLIGIGSYGEGLAAIPSARADVEALAEVLLDPAPGRPPAPDLQSLSIAGGGVELGSGGKQSRSSCYSFAGWRLHPLLVQHLALLVMQHLLRVIQQASLDA